MRMQEVEAELAFKTQLLSSIHEAIIAVDENETFIYWNEMAERILGWKSSEAIGKQLSVVFGEPQAGHLWSEITETLKRLSSYDSEIYGRRKDGTVLYAELHCKRISGLPGNVKGTVITLKDITERIEYTQTLLKKEREYQEILVGHQRLLDMLETLPVMLCLITPDYHIVFANSAFREKFGELNGRPCYEYCYGFTEPCPFCESLIPLKTGQPHHWELTTPDGNNILEAHDLPFSDTDGSPLILEMDIDITERRRAEEALHKSEEKFRVAQELSPDGFSIFKPLRDENGQIADFTWIYENDAIARLNGTDPKAVAGQRLLDLFPHHRGSIFLEAYLKVANTGEPCVFEAEYGSDSMIKPTWFRIVTVRMGEDIAVLAQDITERKSIEELLQKSNEALKKSIEMKDEFLSLISHEFRTPLTVIISATQMIKTLSWNELSDKAKKYFNTIQQNSNRQLKLVNNILDITKANAGSFELHKTNSDTVQLTKRIIESIGPYAERKKIAVSFSFDPAKIIIGIDEEKYERILLNLLSNAIKYTPKGESITVKLSKKTVKNKSMACIQICDSGIGIPADKQERIFERFGQVDSSLSRQAEGTGIGLHLTRMFVEMLGGEIRVNSKLGTGSTFTILLPFIKVEETLSEKMAHEISDNRTIRLTEIEFSDIYLDK